MLMEKIIINLCAILATKQKKQNIIKPFKIWTSYTLGV